LRVVHVGVLFVIGNRDVRDSANFYGIAFLANIAFIGSVTVGGGKNHRYNLSDGAMLKDNHVDAYGGITGAVTALRKKIGHMVKIELEVRNLDELQEALETGVEIIMLDNMSCEDMKKAVELTAGRALLEASGNVTEANIREIAETGVDIISLGALTHSVKCFDISMRIEK
jgi:nicotinate-nucleotide pyrophosphorylase (carboxylating)